MRPGKKKDSMDSLLVASYDSAVSSSNSSCSEDEYLDYLNAKLYARTGHPLNNYQCGPRRIMRLSLCLLMATLLLIYCALSAYTYGTLPRHGELSDWSFDTSKNISDYIFPENDTTLIEPRNACNDKVFLFIIVCSSPQNFLSRQIIRRTWGNVTEFNYGLFSQMHAHLKGEFLDVDVERVKYYSEYLGLKHNTTKVPPMLSVRVVFLVGRSYFETNATMTLIQQEAQQYDDLIQEDFIDTYNNLTLKSMFALKWMTQRCLHQTAFFMKSDDDTFITIPNLLHYLLGGTVPIYNDTLDMYDVRSAKALSPHNRLNITHGFLGGYLFCVVRPVAERGSKWYMPYYMYPEEKYPKYLSGAAYVMSIDVVERLYRIAPKIPLVYLEDVYVTGLCAVNVNVSRKHIPLFNYDYIHKPCSFKGTISQHNLKETESIMTDTYNFVIDTSIACKPPSKIFKRLRLGINVHCTS